MTRARKLPSGRWQARYYVTEGGEQTSRSAGTFATKRDAQDAIDTELAKIRQGKWIDPLLGKITVGTWCEQWYAARKPNKRTRSFLDARILPKWKDWQLDEVRNLHVKAWVRELVDAGLSPVTVRALYTTFAGMLTDAVHEDRLAKSPCWSGRDGLPVVKRTRLNYLDAEQGRRLIELAPARYKAMFHLALWTGMRWQELAALRWDNVDLAAGVIVVSEAVKREDHTIGAPKNGNTREVIIDPVTADVLRAHRRDFGAFDLVFTSPRGKLLVYTNFRRNVMTPLVEALELDWPLTFHSLRHTYVSTLLESGVDALVVAKYAGHSRASFTTDRYGTARHDSADVVREAITRAMARQRPASED